MATQPSQTVGLTGEDMKAAGSVFTPRVTVASPGVRVLPDSGFAKQLTQAHPAYVGFNEITFRGELVTNPVFLDKYTEDVFGLAAQDPANQAWVADPAIAAQRKATFKQNVVNRLAKDMYTGMDSRGYVINQELSAAAKETSPFPVGRLQSANDILLDAVRWEESRDGKYLVSPVGALGPYQVMPDTARAPGFGVRPLSDPMNEDESRRFASDYLNAMLKRYDGDVRKALAAYNWGPGKADKWDGRDESLPAETRKYVNAIVPKLGIKKNTTPEPVRRNPRPTTLDAGQIKSIVASNPVVFAGMGIADDKGKLLYSEQVVAEQIGANPEMAKMFYEAQYDMMLQQLSKSNNSYFDTSDPDAMSKAWVVYSRFGPETLTQYVNLTQFADPKLSFEQQLPQAKSAMLALRSVQKNGQNVFGAIDDWFTQNGPADYTGIIRSAELQQKGPLDLNGYTTYLHMAKDTRTGIEKLVTDLSAAAGPTTMGSIWASLTGETPKNPSQIANIVAADLKAGTLSKDSKGFYLDILRQAQKENSSFTIQDIFNTIISHSKPVAGEQGRYKYSFNYDQLPDQAKIAVNTLRVNDNQYQNMVIKQADGSYIFEPGRFDRLSEKFTGWGAVVTESHPSWNPDGTYAGMKDIPSTGVFAQIANMGSAFVFESGQFAVDYLLAPGLRATGAAAGAFGWEELEQATEVGVANEWMRDFQDKNLLEQVDGMGVKATVYGTEMALYMAAMYATGGMASAGLARTGISAARYLETASAGRKAHQLYDAGRILAAPTTTRLGAMTQKFATGVETNAAWAVPLRFELGGAGLELLGGQEKSIYNGGLVDSALEAITGGQFDTEKAYLVSDRITQFGVDALTGFALGNVFDNAWAATKYGTNVARRRGGRGLAMGADGYYETVAKPVFGPDWRRFMYNVSDGLQEIPIGTFEDSIKNQFNGRMIGYAADNIETVNDVALNFHHQTGEIYETLMQDITNSIRYYDAKLGKTAMSDDQVAARAKQIYDGALQDLSDSMLGVLKGGDNTNANRFAWRFLDALDEQGPVVKQVSETKQGIESTTFDLATAVRLRAAQPNRVIKSAGDNLYTVHEVDMNFWSVDLARNLRQGLTEQSADEFINRSMRRAGYDPQAPPAESEKLLTELAEIAPHMAGRPFLTRAGGKSSLGYVESYDGKAFYIRDSETGELRKMLDNEVLDFVARKGRAEDPAARLPEQGTVRQRGREVAPSSGQVFEMGGMTEAGARVVPGTEGVSIRGGDTEAYKNSLYTQLRDRVAQVGPEITIGEDGVRRVINLDGTDLFNVAQLRRMESTEKDIYEAMFGNQLQEFDELKLKLAEVEGKSYASPSYKQKKINELNARIAAKQEELADLQAYSDVLISQTNQMVAQEIPKKVRKAKNAAKKVEEIKNDSPAVKETLNPEDCAPGTIKSVPRSSVPKKTTKSEKRGGSMWGDDPYAFD
jgi:soluble lytic murein transglycosylase